MSLRALCIGVLSLRLRAWQGSRIFPMRRSQPWRSIGASDILSSDVEEWIDHRSALRDGCTCKQIMCVHAHGSVLWDRQGDPPPVRTLSLALSECGDPESIAELWRPSVLAKAQGEGVTQGRGRRAWAVCGVVRSHVVTPAVPEASGSYRNVPSCSRPLGVFKVGSGICLGRRKKRCKLAHTRCRVRADIPTHSGCSASATLEHGAEEHRGETTAIKRLGQARVGVTFSETACRCPASGGRSS